MTLRVELYDGGPEAWDELVAAHGSLYQTFAFGEALRRGMRRRIVRLCAMDRDGLRAHISLAVSKSLLFGRYAISLPGCDHAGLCAADADSAELLVAQAAEIRRRENLEFVEIRHVAGDPHVPAALPCSGHKLTQELELPGDPDALWAALKGTVRSRVRKGRKAGLEHRTGGDELLDAFFAVYSSNLRDLGVPHYPRRFFAALLGGFRDCATVHVTSLQGRVVAGALTLTDGARQRMPFTASYRWAHSYAPNDFLFWSLLTDAIERGCDVFDFGRSLPDSGTYRFKNKWGAVDRPLHWFYQLRSGVSPPPPRSHSPPYRQASTIWKKLPEPVTRWLGPKLARRLP